MVVDKSGMYEVLETLHQQVISGQDLAKDLKINQRPKSICIAGMGGSALGGYLLQQYMEERSDIPVFVVENYGLPQHITSESFMFVVSYSGNTEETLEVFLEGKKRKIPMLCISNEGKLKEMAIQSKTPHIKLNNYPQPRLSVIEQLFCMLKIIENSGFIKKEGEHILKLITLIKKNQLQKTAEALADNIKQNIPIIYPTQKLYAASRIWKACINENTKSKAFINFFPALNHNEFQSYEYGADNYYVIILTLDDEHVRMVKRIKVTKEILEKKGVKISNLQMTGECYLSKLISSTILGMWTAYFLAVKKGIDPSPVIMVEELKKKLGGGK